jgi:hypothetical protein
MDPLENERATAHDLVSYARGQGVDLESLCKESVFQKDRRWIILWRKRDGLPCSGPAQEPEGMLHYSLQGAIDQLPGALPDSARAFQGAWTEAGTLEGLEQAFELVKAWLFDGKKIDDLPPRSVRRYGI